MAKSPNNTSEEKKAAGACLTILLPSAPRAPHTPSPPAPLTPLLLVARFKALRITIKARDFPDTPAGKGFPSKCNASAKKELADEIGADLANYASRTTLPKKSKLGW